MGLISRVSSRTYRFFFKMSMERVRIIAEKAIWIVLSAFVIQRYNLIEVHKHESLKSRWFYTAVACFSFDVLIFLFLQGYLSLVCKANGHDDTIDKRFPVTIPIATFIFVVGAICFNYSLWGVLGLMTPVVSFILFMGFIVIVASIPSAEVTPVETELLQESLRKKKEEETKLD